MTPFSYVFVSSAKTFKKLRNVVRLAFYRLRLATRGTRHLCTLAMVVDVLAHRFGIAVFHHGLATTTRLYQQTGDTFAFVPTKPTIDAHIGHAHDLTNIL